MIGHALLLQQEGEQLHPVAAGGVDVVQPALRNVPGHQFRHRLVDGLRPQTAAEGEQADLPRRNAQPRAGGFPVGGKHLRTDGIAGDDVITAGRQALFGFRHREKETVHLFGDHAVGNAGEGVGLVGHAGNALPGGFQQNGRADVAAGAEHDVGGKLPQEPAGTAAGGQQQTDALAVVADVAPGKAALDAQRTERGKIKAGARDQRRFHGIGIADKEDAALWHALAQLGGDGQRGIDVSGGTAAGEQDFHKNATPFPLSFGGRPTE